MSNAVDVIDLTRKLIAFNTINPPGNEESCARYVGELLIKHGFDVSYHAFSERRTSVVARRGRSAAPKRDSDRGVPICFTGHLDTVPLGAAKWSVDPFAGTIRDGKLYGRGSSDMKSGVAAMVAAAIACGEPLDDGPGILLVLTAGEETGCDGAAQLISLGDVLGTAGAIIVGEPTVNYPRVGHKGALWLVAETHGVTAHGSMPELGVNAVYRGAKLVAKLEDFGFNEAPHSVLGSPTLSVGRMHGGLNINSVPDRAEIGLDIRTLPGMDHRELMGWLRSHLAPELDGLKSVVDLHPVWTDPNDPWVRRIFNLVAKHIGEQPEPRGVPFFSDASVLKPALGQPPTIILGPGEPKMAHQTDEYCGVELLEQAVKIYIDLICDWQLDHRRWKAPSGKTRSQADVTESQVT